MTELKLKHLEFLQGVINRLSTNSFLLKGWSVLLVSALIGLSAESSKKVFTILAFLPGFVFWGLDGYFLMLERAYRKLYNRVRKLPPKEIDFSMNPQDAMGEDSEGVLSTTVNDLENWCEAVFSKTLVPFHGVLLTAVGGSYFLLG